MRKGSLALGLRKLWLSAVAWFEGVWGGRFRSLFVFELGLSRSLEFFLGFLGVE